MGSRQNGCLWSDRIWDKHAPQAPASSRIKDLGKAREIKCEREIMADCVRALDCLCVNADLISGSQLLRSVGLPHPLHLPLPFMMLDLPNRGKLILSSRT